MNKLNNLYCRLCAEIKESDKLIDLQLDTERCQETLQRLSYLNAKDVDILGQNLLPKTVCVPCSYALHEAYHFISKVNKAQTILLNLFVKTEQEENISDTDDGLIEVFDVEVDIDAENDVKNESLNSTLLEQENSSYIEIKTELKEECEKDVKQSPLDLKMHAIFNAAICSTDKSGMTWYAEELVTPEDRSWKGYSWICHHCFMCFPDLDTLRTHSKDLHGNCYGFSCIDCNTINRTFDSFVEHVRAHRRYLRYQCQYCDTPINKRTSKTHLEEHFQKSQVACTTCGEILDDEDALQKHTLQYVVTAEPKKPRRKRGEPITLNDLTCRTCKRVYKTMNSLRDHQKVHVKERTRNYTCDRCGKAFYNKGTLTSHITSHDQDKPHVCKICNKSFLFPNLLRRHVEMHSGVKPFSCDQCGRCFRLKYQLNSHKIIHTDQMPFMCQFCSKSFRFKQILKNHERQHTGCKPYSCNICHMEFTNWSNYNKHMKRRHNTDTARKKITPAGVFPVNPLTGRIVEIEDPVATAEWKSKIMIPCKRGKKKVMQ